MVMKKRRLNQGYGFCPKCGKEMPIAVPPYLREGLRKQGRLCECGKK